MKIKKMFNNILKNDRSSKVREIVNFYKVIGKKITTYDPRLKNTLLDPTDIKSIEYHKSPRVLTEDEMTKYIDIKVKPGPTKKTTVKELKIVDYTERRNRTNIVLKNK